MRVEGVKGKRWFAGGSIAEASLGKLGRHGILALRAGGRQYLVPLSTCVCDARYRVVVDGVEYCEAELCRGFIEDLSENSIPGITVTGRVPRPGEDPRPLGEDTTNPLVVYSGPRGRYVLKGYREASRHNYEPYFYEYLWGRGVTPGFKAYYLYNGYPLGLSTTYVSGVDGGKPFYESLSRLLSGGGLRIPRREAGLATQSLAAFHSAMRGCRDWWCGSREASPDDVEEWRRRIEYYYSHVSAEGIRDRVDRALEEMERFIGHRVQRIHQDLHLSQYLYTGDSYLIVDFEGEPGRPERWRSALEPPVRDFASLLRSLSYIVFFALKEKLGTGFEETAEALLKGEGDAALAVSWSRGVARLLAEEYLRSLKAGGFNDPKSVDELLKLAEPWFVERGLYEIYYEEMFRGKYAVVAASTLEARIPL